MFVDSQQSIDIGRGGR